MVLPPAPAKASMRIFCDAGADAATCSAIVLDGGLVLLRFNRHLGFWFFGELRRLTVIWKKRREHLLCHRFWCHAKPSIVGHPDTFIVSGENIVTLVPVPVLVSVIRSLTFLIQRPELQDTSECYLASLKIRHNAEHPLVVETAV